MSIEMIKELSELDYLGSHGYSHDTKTGISDTELLSDLMRNQEFIKSHTGKYTNYISYPFGNKIAVSKNVGEIAVQAHHKIGFTIERAFATNANFPLLLPRLDANDIPEGKNQLFLIAENKLILKKGIALGSSWFKP